jgi:hypothetical protein
MASSSIFGPGALSPVTIRNPASSAFPSRPGLSIIPDVVFPGPILSPVQPLFPLPTFPTFPFPFPQPQPQPQPPASPTASATDLQVLVASIPVAQEGHVITSEYHNALRNALVSIVNRMGLGTVSEEVTISNAPVLIHHDSVRGWEQGYGVARKPGDFSGNVHGWMEMELPDGARIRRMLVFGDKTGPGTLRVRLRRQQITNPALDATLIEVTIGDVDPAQGVEGDVTLPGTGAGAAAIEEFRIVNNREHKYLFIAELDGANNETTAQVNAIQIVCSR